MVNLNIPIDEQLFQKISSQAIVQRLSVEIFLARFIEHNFIETNPIINEVKPQFIFRKLRYEALQQGINKLSVEEINAKVKSRRGERN